MLNHFARNLRYSLAAVGLLTISCGLGSVRAQLEQPSPQPTAQPSSETVIKPVEAQTPDAEKAPEEKAPEAKQEPAKQEPAKKSAKEKLPPKKQLRAIALSGSYDDLAQAASFDPTSLLLGGGVGKSKSFYRLCDYIEEMANEPNLSHVLFDLSDSDIGFNSAQLDELARRLDKLKAKGKKMIAWLENASNVHLSIASSCDEIVMADFGGVDMPSSALETMFYRDAMDLVGVKASIVRAGDFKGAVEPYTNPVMSEHLKSHYLAMLESINGAQISRIAKGRGLTNAAIRDLQKKRMLLPAEALAAGLVTKLAPYGSMRNTVQESVGKDIEWTTPKAKPKRDISFFELMSKAMAGPKEAQRVKEDSIAVLHLSGSIMDGKQASPGEIISGPTVKAIEELTQEDRVKGVVVRINSPGGSATASEAIRQALDQLAKKKPVVFSMGEMAASGGYWITCIGQPIYAERGTITGSIGVFSLKLSLGTMLRRVGVHVESVSLDESASSNAIDRAWSDSEIANMQRFIDDVYHRFLAIASKSRNMSVEKLQTLAGGRVWSGEQAKMHGLVDEMGGVDDCIAVVAKKSGIEKFKILSKPEPASGFDLFRMLDDSGDGDIDIGLNGVLKEGAFAEWESKLIGLMGHRGFRFNTTLSLLRDAFQSKTGQPKIWALMPQELNVR